MSRNSRAIFQGPSSLTEQRRTEIEQCIARRWTDFMIRVADECRVNLADAIEAFKDMQDAADAVDGESPQKRGPKEDGRRQPCGTPTAYERHRRHHEEPCQPCKDAEDEYRLIRRQQRRQLA